MSFIAMPDDNPFAPEPSATLQARLRAVDGRLFMRYFPIGSGAFGFCERWTDDDPRRETIRNGSVAPNKDFDVLGWAPPGMSEEDAFQVLEKNLREKASKGSVTHNDMLANVLSMNASTTALNMAGTREFAHEMLDANQSTIGSKIISRGAGFSTEGGKIVGTPKIQRTGLTKNERDAKREWSEK